MSVYARPRGLARTGNFLINGVRRLLEVAETITPAYMIAINKDHYQERGKSAYVDVREKDAAQIADEIRFMVYNWLLRNVC